MSGQSQLKRWLYLLPAVFLAALAVEPVTATHSQEQGDGSFDTAAVDRLVEATRREFGYRGIAVAVTRADKVLYTRGYGVADDAGTPVTADTPFVMGSTSKSIAGVAVMQLVEAGKLDIGAPVTRYLPWFRTRDKAESDRITLAMLLGHTSGLPYIFRGDEDIDGQESGSLLEEAVRAAAGAELNFPPGTRFAYSNLGYKTLGLIVQSVSGEPYDEYLERHIFAPLEMTRTFTSWRKAQAQGLTNGYSYRLGVYFLLANHPSSSLLPEGGVISTANDLAHYLIAQADDGRYNGVAIVSPEGSRRLHEPFLLQSDTQTKTKEKGSTGYAMGWYVRHYAGHTMFTHSGEFPGFTSLFAVVPANHCGVAVLNNSVRDIVPDFDPTTRIGVAAAALCAGLPLPPRGSWGSQEVLYGSILVALILQGGYLFFCWSGRGPHRLLEILAVPTSVAAVLASANQFLSAGVSVPFAWVFAPNVVITMFLNVAIGVLTLTTFGGRVPRLARRFTAWRRGKK